MVDCRPGSNIYIPNEKPNGIEPFFAYLQYVLAGLPYLGTRHSRGL